MHRYLPSLTTCSSYSSFPGVRPEVVWDQCHQREGGGASELAVVGLTGRSSFLEWPAQLWLGRCGIKHLIPVQSCGFVVSGSCSTPVAWSSCACQQLQCRCGGTGPAGDLGSCLSQLSQKTLGVKPPLEPFSSASLEGLFASLVLWGSSHRGLGVRTGVRRRLSECELVGCAVLGEAVEALSQCWERA